MCLPEILDQHEDAARFIRLRVKNRPTVGGNRDMVIHGTLNCQDFPSLAASEFVEADITVSHFVGCSEKVNALLHNRPLAFTMHGVENLGFLTAIDLGSPDTHGLRPSLHVIEEFAVG